MEEVASLHRLKDLLIRFETETNRQMKEIYVSWVSLGHLSSPKLVPPISVKCNPSPLVPLWSVHFADETSW